LAPKLAPFITPNDQKFSRQWHLQSYPGVNAPEAWDQLQGVSLSDVSVAIIDDGFEYTHGDLAASFVNRPENGRH
jgi:subtilisin family serine protease